MMYDQHGDGVPDDELDDEDGEVPGEDREAAVQQDPYDDGGLDWDVSLRTQSREEAVEGGYLQDWEELQARDLESADVAGSDLPPPQVSEDASRAKRDSRTTKALIQRFGATPGCRSCEIIMGARAGKPASHLAECRARFEAALAGDEEMKKVLKRRDVRHGLAEGDAGDESDDEPDAKRQRAIEEPESVERQSVPSEALFGQS